MTEPALVVEGARRRFTRRGSDEVIHALDGVDLCVAAGSITAVLGPSGCGKTTLLRAIAGTESLDAGRITIGGTVVADASSTAAASTATEVFGRATKLPATGCGTASTPSWVRASSAPSRTARSWSRPGRSSPC